MSYSSVVLGDSPVVFWKLDETSGTSMADATGNGHAGTYTSSPTLGVTALVPTEVGTGTAVEFTNGTYGGLSTIPGGQTANASVELWLRVKKWGVFQSGTAFFSSSTNNGLLCGYWVSASELRFYRFSNGWTYGVINPGKYLGDGGRHHLVQTYDQSNIKVYIDNVLVLTQAATGALGAGASDNNGFFLARYNGASGYDVVIDAFSYYGVALTSTQVNNHFTAGVGAFTLADGYVPGTSDAYAQAVLADSPKMYLRMGEPAGTASALDSSGNDNHGAYDGAPTLGATGLLRSTTDKAATFAATDRIYFQTGGNLHIGGTTASVEYWVKYGTLEGTIFSQGNSGGMLSGLFSSSTDMRWYRYSGSYTYATLNPTTNLGTAKHQVVHVYDGSHITVYIDGSQVVQVAATGAMSYDNAWPDAINFYDGAGTGAAVTIDEFSFYSTALSSTRVTAHYNAGVSTSLETEAQAKFLVRANLAAGLRAHFLVRAGLTTDARDRFLVRSLLSSPSRTGFRVRAGLSASGRARFLVSLALVARARARFLSRPALDTAAASHFLVHHASGSPVFFVSLFAVVSKLAASFGEQSALALTYAVATKLSATFTRSEAVPTPNSTITSTATLKDVNGASVNSVSTVTVTATFPDGSTQAFSQSGGTVTASGTGTYSITYVTKGVGLITEDWAFVANDTVTKAEAHNEVPVSF